MGIGTPPAGAWAGRTRRRLPEARVEEYEREQRPVRLSVLEVRVVTFLRRRPAPEDLKRQLAAAERDNARLRHEVARWRELYETERVAHRETSRSKDHYKAQARERRNGGKTW